MVRTKPVGLAAALGREAERNADEHENQAGEGVGKALVELDAVGPGRLDLGGSGVRGFAWSATADELGEREREDGGVGAGEAGVFLGAADEGLVCGAEGGDVVLVGVGGRDVVLAAVFEQEMEDGGGGWAGAGNGCCRHTIDEGLVGSGDFGAGGLVEIGEEDVAPESDSRAGAHVLDVEDGIFVAFVEDAGLDFEGDLRVAEPAFEAEQSGRGVGREVDGIEEAEREGEEAHK